MGARRTYTDDDLVAAVAASTSWRGVLRALGLLGTSSAAARSVRSHAERLEIDYGNFTGRRRWSDAQLRASAAEARSWADVTAALGLQGGSATTTVKGHAARLGVEVDHLDSTSAPAQGVELVPDTVHLSRAGALLAAGWYTLCGANVSWPLEPARYDLLVGAGADIRRVQVKTTTTREGNSWKVYLSTSRRGRTLYDAEEIDEFFVVDGDLSYYVIPLGAVLGVHAVHLSAYERFRVLTCPATQE